MNRVKAPVSLSKELFDRGDRMARKMKVSRSKLLQAAFEDYLRRAKIQRMVDSLNEFYAEGPDEEETQIRAAMPQLQAGLLKDDPW